jgi:hypothetical protein
MGKPLTIVFTEGLLSNQDNDIFILLLGFGALPEKMGSDSGFSRDRPAPSHTVTLQAWKGWGHSEPAPTSAPWRMDGKWSGNSFLLGSSSLANDGG